VNPFPDLRAAAPENAQLRPTPVFFREVADLRGPGALRLILDLLKFRLSN